MPAHIGATGEQPHPIYGMTLRDWFASNALGSLVTADSAENHSQLAADGVNDGTYFGRGFTDECYWEDVAKSAYAIADAMIKARGGSK
jgi:hypothetical protein